MENNILLWIIQMVKIKLTVIIFPKKNIIKNYLLLNIIKGFCYV